jgi:hypothetical protein
MFLYNLLESFAGLVPPLHCVTQRERKDDSYQMVVPWE